MNGSSWKGTPARSGLPIMRRKNSATSFTWICPRRDPASNRANPSGSVESVKAVSDIYSPLSGEVIEVNQALADRPETLNSDPHGAGWLVKVHLSAPAEAAAPDDRGRVSSLHRSGEVVCGIFPSPSPNAARCSKPAASSLPKGYSPTCRRKSAWIGRSTSRRGSPNTRSWTISGGARRRMPTGTRLFWERGCTRTTVRCWWMRWCRAASS